MNEYQSSIARKKNMENVNKKSGVVIFCAVVGVVMVFLTLRILPATGSDSPEVLKKLAADYGYADDPIREMAFGAEGLAAFAYCRIKTENGEVYLRIRKATAFHDWKVVEFQEKKEVSGEPSKLSEPPE